jgi:hypothetical protein
MRPITLALLVLTLSGCAKSIPGYEGPPVKVRVQDNTVQITVNRTEAGWHAIPERARVENNTARVWITLRRGTGHGGDDVESSKIMQLGSGWFDNKSFVCCQVFARIRTSTHPGSYISAATGCE